MISLSIILVTEYAASAAGIVHCCIDVGVVVAPQNFVRVRNAPCSIPNMAPGNKRQNSSAVLRHFSLGDSFRQGLVSSLAFELLICSTAILYGEGK